MKTLNFPTSACRVCRYYRPEGRRGGTCQQLGVPVSANWKACALALPPFAPSWERMETILHDERLVLKEALSVNTSLGGSKPNLGEEKSLSTPEKLTADTVLA